MAEKKSGISKTEAVRQAMGKVGVDAERAELHKFIKEQFGIEITPDQVSNIRSELRGRKKQPAPKPLVRAAPGTSVAKAVTPAKGVTVISLADIAAAKDLLTRSSAADLKQLLDLLAR